MSKMTEFKDSWINSFPSGKTWLNKLGSPHTKEKFTAYFKVYCDTVQKTPEELISLKVEGLQNVGTTKEFQAENLLESFFSESKMKPTAKLMLKNAVFSFYKHNRRALEPQTASNIKNETPESKMRKPTLELRDIDQIMNYQKKTKAKEAIIYIANDTEVPESVKCYAAYDGVKIRRTLWQLH
jgi:hypothetical protein